MKSFINSSAFALLMAEYSQAVQNEHWARNIGGIGTPDDKILYELITNQTIDNIEGYHLQVQLYYKTRDFRELHGNLTLTTKGL